MSIEMKDLINPAVSLGAIALAYFKLRSGNEREKGVIAEKLTHISERIIKIESMDFLTKKDCSDCPERVRMKSVEACVNKLERVVSRNEEKTNEFIKNLSAFMGGVKKFMELHSETLTYYREQKLATRVEHLERSIKKE